MKKIKDKKCKACSSPFAPRMPMQKVCGVKCSIDLARIDREDKAKKENRAKKRQLLDNDRSHWVKKAQAEFNKWVRLRDEKEPCISCGRNHSGQYHAGHYRSVGAQPALRFEPLNCHKQCAPCNNHKSGNITEYRINLKIKIGERMVEWLETEHEPKNYSIDDLKEIYHYYRNEIKKLKESKEVAII